jgi:hypothetical protein
LGGENKNFKATTIVLRKKIEFKHHKANGDPLHGMTIVLQMPKSQDEPTRCNSNKNFTNRDISRNQTQDMTIR